jgi:uncharacterized cupin superfamily protein
MSGPKLHVLPALREAPLVPVPADKVLQGQPATRTWVLYEEPDGKLASGQWEATPGKWRINYAEWEYMVMISGRCVVEGDDGTRITAGPGDAFVIEPGFAGTWEVLETMRKHWVIEER